MKKKGYRGPRRARGWRRYKFVDAQLVLITATCTNVLLVVVASRSVPLVSQVTCRIASNAMGVTRTPQKMGVKSRARTVQSNDQELTKTKW
jgi:hypothetical protein